MECVMYQVKGGASIIDLYRAVCAEKQEEDEDYAEADVEVAEAETSELDDDDLDHIDEMRARAMAGQWRVRFFICLPSG